MTVASPFATQDWNRNGVKTTPVRILTSSSAWPAVAAGAGPGWVVVRQPLEMLKSGTATAADCLVLESGDLAAFSVDELARWGLPVVLVLGDSDDGAARGVPALADRADGFVFADDDAATIRAVLARVTAGAPGLQVSDLSDGTARTINALSAEAGRIADALARLADQQRNRAVAQQPVDAGFVRRLLKVRRERERFFPAEIFADPAWDMLLDLIAAQLEGKPVPVSSLCIAAAVPTTTALRWIRSLSEAGLFVRQTDPGDARRTWISLSPDAADAILAWLRLFAGQFALR